MVNDQITNQELRETLNAIKARLDLCATKDDLKAFATKDDLKAFATKDDLKAMEQRFNEKFVTKDDLKNDLKAMEIRLDRKLDSIRRTNTRHHLRTREDVGYLNKKLGDMQEGLRQAAGLS